MNGGAVEKIALEPLIRRLRLLELDHEPNGYPAVTMGEISALLGMNQSPAAWAPVAERMPPSLIPVLVCYRNRSGNLRRVRACWVPAKTQISGDDSDIAEYDEQHDIFYDPEGWYEQIENWDAYSGVVIHDGTPTHWMFLPEPPPDA